MTARRLTPRWRCRPDDAGSDAPRDRDQPAGLIGHSDVSVTVGAPDRDAEPRQLTQEQRRRVPIVVVQAHADHAHRGVHGREEVRIGVRRAVVRDFEHIGVHVDVGGEHRLLRFHLGVAGQEDAALADGRAKHE